MDVHEIEDQHSQMMQGQLQTLRQAQKRKGQRPHDRKPRQLEYIQFMAGLTAAQRVGQEQGNYMIHTSFIPPAYPPCIMPLAELSPIAIRDLQLETHHRGTYLLLRSITPPSRMTAIMALGEDERGDVVLLQLYQQLEEKIRKAADVVDTGTVLLVKEPYYKAMANGSYGLRVDHISDVIHVVKNDSKIPKAWRAQVPEAKRTAESLKLEGNSAMGKAEYSQAITKYSDALAQQATTEEINIIKRNRALAFLRTKQFDAALLDTGFPDFGSNPSEKALFRAAEALYHLGRFNECREVLEQLCASFPSNEQASQTLDRARRRCAEQNTGEYNFKHLRTEAEKLRPPQLDHATYIGPVEIRSAANKGRGLFVTKAVKAGDLLMCEKAFSHAYADENDKTNSSITFLMNLETSKGFIGGQAELIKTIVQKLHSNPSLARKFTTLYHGDYEAVATSMVDGKPVVDTFLVERIMNLNVFGCPSISSFHAHAQRFEDASKESVAFHSCGIWTQASYINHSCTSNARRSFIGDMMIVRATQDVEPGTEIRFWYKGPAASKDMGNEFKNWGFACDCAICQDAKETTPAVKKRRETLMKELKRACDVPTEYEIQPQKMEAILDTVNKTYTQPPDKVPRLLLWDPQLLLARVYSSNNQIEKGLAAVAKVLTALGFIILGADFSSAPFRIIKWGFVVEHLVEVFLHARNAFGDIGSRRDSMQAEQYARVAYKMIVGEDTSFDLSHGGFGQN